MTPDELVERAARAIDPHMDEPPGDHPEFVNFRRMRREMALRKATDAIAVARPVLRTETLEEAAKAAEGQHGGCDCYDCAIRADIAAAIRALIKKENGDDA